MSWFNKRKNQSVIPPVQEPPSLSSSRTPSYRSSENTYVPEASGYSEYNDRRTYADSHPSNFSNMRQNSGGYGSKSNYDQTYGGSYDKPYGRSASGGVTDPYARGERDLDSDRNALFAGSAPAEEGRTSNRFMDGPANDRPTPNPGEEEEEDVEAIKAQTRFLKQDTVSSTRNALRIAREAEETGRATLLRLGEQSEKIANTERHLDVSKGHSVRADDNADEIKKLNRSIFIPAITFNKDQKRRAQELKREQRYQEEMTDRELAMEDIRESHNRIGRAGTLNSGFDDDEGIGGRRQKTATELNMRKEQRKKFQFEATNSDDELEDELDDNLDELLDATKRMKSLGLAMGSELTTQNERLERITGKADKLTMRIDANTSKLKRIK